MKHLDSVKLGHFGDAFGRPSAESPPWLEPDVDANADMWALPRSLGTSCSDCIVGRRRTQMRPLPPSVLTPQATCPGGRRASAGHPPTYVGSDDRRDEPPTGHADIVRELIESSIGFPQDNPKMAPGEEDWWSESRNRLERTARDASTSG